VKTLADLKGRKIGYSVGGFRGSPAQDDAGQGQSQAGGRDPGERQLLAIAGAAVEAGGRGDRRFSQFRAEPARSGQKAGSGVLPEEEGVPPYDELVLVANREELNDPRLGRFMAALEQATLYIVNHPDDAWKAFMTQHKDLDDELNRRAWRDTLPRLARRPAALDEARYKRFAHFFVQTGRDHRGAAGFQLRRAIAVAGMRR
jgi:putative hydroxymethylpyrimidine transport system substrate-binding protein